jgi:hypothetical protein
MSTPVTAGEVVEGTDVWNGSALCHVTGKKVDENTGSIYISWTENLGGREADFGGSFQPGVHFGEMTTI